MNDDVLGANGVDNALMARALAGEDVAFELLVVKYQRRVAATVWRLVSDDRIAEELTQEVFLKLYAGLASYRAGDDFAAWLFTIARNTARSYLRSGQNRLDDRPRAEPEEGQNAGHGGHASGPEDEAVARELFERIDAEMAALPEAQRRALWLREIDGLSYQAIAESTAQPVNTVKSHIYRAREALAARLRPLLAPTRDRRW